MLFNTSSIDSAYMASVKLIGILSSAFLAYIVYLAVYRIWFHPLSKFPGPLISAAVYLPYHYQSYVQGTWVKKMRDLHEVYGPIVRIAPDFLAIDCAIAWPDIYAHRPGAKEEFQTPRGFFFDGDSTCLFAAPRDEHRRMRRHLGQAFSDRGLRDQEMKMTKYTDILLEKLDKLSQKGKSLDISEWLSFTMFDIIGDLSLGTSFKSLETDAYHPWFLFLLLNIRKAMFFRFLGSFPMVKMILGYLSGQVPDGKDDSKGNAMAAIEMINERMAHGVESPSGQRDFMAYMMQKSRSGEEGMSRQEIVSTMPLLFLAGSEPMATSVSGLLFYLSQYPEAYKTLAEEVRSTFTNEADINLQSTASLEYLSACIEECLRIYPPVPDMTPRVSPGDVVQDQFIPAGTRIYVYPYATFRDPKYFTDPEKFVPERWLSPSHPLYDAKFANDNRAACKPFSYGPRDCLGKNLAYAEIRLVAARFIYRFNYKLVANQKDWVEDQRVFVGWEKGPLKIELERRLED